MINIKAQEMSIQTVVVLILIMLVLVIIIAFAVPALTDMFGGLSDVSDSTLDQLDTSPIDAITGNGEIENGNGEVLE